MNTLLTPNRRLAATLIKQHQEVGKKTWATPTILPLATWLENQWLTQLSDKTLLLTSFQEQWLWEEIIRPDTGLHISSLAKEAMSAWSILKQWHISYDHPLMSLTEESILFQKWAREFEQTCRKNNWLDHASLPDKLMLNQDLIELRGFIELSPQIKKLFKRDLEIINPNPTHKVYRVEVKDSTEELLQLAAWARKTYQPNLKIGCIIPNLENIRDEVQRIFADLPCNISAGKKLNQYPLIHTALQILLLKPVVSIETISHLLRSPFIGDAEKESQQRALLLNDLLKLNKPTLKLDSLPFAKIISVKTKLSASQWAKHFNESLTLMGWPGERSVNSEEYQLIQNGWMPLLKEFSKLDVMTESLTQKEAHHYLNLLADKTIFQLQTPDAPIQILGTLEAAGMTFDYAWVMGLNDTTWPPSPSPNPFIPLRLQKKLNMPNASAERELDYCKKLTQQFIQHSSTIIFSSAREEGDVKLRPSALIQSYPLISLAEPHFSSCAEIIFKSRALEELNDSVGPAITADDITKGGANILKYQAACPFKAYAELRLKASSIDEPIAGLSALDRGKIMHKTLELLWTELKDQKKLLSLTKIELTELVSDCIDKSFNFNNSRYHIIEKKRLAKIILNWLETEKLRPDFKVVALEEERAITLNKISIKLRVDRIDSLESQQKLIIDYKTGASVNINDWFGDRPNEPQLPLYCLTEPNKVGIAFAQLHANNIGLKSLDIASDAQLNQWKITLSKLENDFCEGIATVDPKHPNQTCAQCKLHSLCRIYTVSAHEYH